MNAGEGIGVDNPLVSAISATAEILMTAAVDSGLVVSYHSVFDELGNIVPWTFAGAGDEGSDCG